jgi:mannosyl-oligosaccharide glucosidase
MPTILHRFQNVGFEKIPVALSSLLIQSKPQDLRHTCEQSDDMAGYGWTAYDARKGGMQIVNDTGNSLDLITQFAKASNDERGGRWGLRVKGIPRTPAGDRQKATVIFYLGSEDPESRTQCTTLHQIDSSNSDVVCEGTMVSMPNFKVQITDDQAISDSSQRTSVHSLTVPADTIWQARSIFTNQLKSSDAVVGGHGEGMLADHPGKGNLQFVQKRFDGAFEFDILFSSNSEAMTSSFLTESIQDALSTFSTRFESAYSPQAPFQDEEHIKFSQALLSNLMGGIGYFYGASRVATPEIAETDQIFGEGAASAQPRATVEEVGPYQLFSSVPSRPVFPRGFLWDEGFHLQVILDWDMDLALEIASSWLDLIDENGWIAREQILGPEARSRIPPEYVTQYLDNANPPTLFLVVQAFVERLSGKVPYSGAPSRHLKDGAAGNAFVKTVYPKLKKHYEWFCRTQAGNLTKYQGPSSNFNQGYRWQDRTPQHLLTSGLDDYPRAQSPYLEDLHVDALCWVGSMALTLGKISIFLGEEADWQFFSKHETDVVRSIEGIHWSEPDQAYCDTTVVDGNRVEMVCHKGYISLFPFLVGLMGPDHSHLEAVLNLIWDPKELWSPYGLRSLSPRDKYYNTGENYWRSPIWININFMAIQRLLVRIIHCSSFLEYDNSFNDQELAQQPGPHQQKAREMYTELRLNLVNTVFNSWKETNFAWEQYSPDTGKGQRTQHFTGWTALIVKILAMPNLQSGTHHQTPGHINQPADTGVWGMTQTLMVMGMSLIAFVFRRTLLRAWRTLMGA